MIVYVLLFTINGHFMNPAPTFKVVTECRQGANMFKNAVLQVIPNASIAFQCVPKTQ
jgi:hypothetical protein